MKYTIKDLKFVRSSIASPEQYDIYLDSGSSESGEDEPVAYIRIRDGILSCVMIPCLSSGDVLTVSQLSDENGDPISVFPDDFERKLYIEEALAKVVDSLNKRELFRKVSCALLHGISACDSCGKCEGEDSVEIRMNLIRGLSEVTNAPLPWSEYGEERGE